MSLEARLDKLESQHRNLDEEVHGLARVCADIKNIALTNQHDVAGLKADVAALTQATHAGFKRADEQHHELVKEVRENQQENREHFNSLETRFDKLETRLDKLETRFDQLELLIRQSLQCN